MNIHKKYFVDNIWNLFKLKNVSEHFLKLEIEAYYLNFEGDFYDFESTTRREQMLDIFEQITRHKLDEDIDEKYKYYLIYLEKNNRNFKRLNRKDFENSLVTTYRNDICFEYLPIEDEKGNIMFADRKQQTKNIFTTETKKKFLEKKLTKFLNEKNKEITKIINKMNKEIMKEKKTRKRSRKYWDDDSTLENPKNPKQSNIEIVEDNIIFESSNSITNEDILNIIKKSNNDVDKILFKILEIVKYLNKQHTNKINNIEIINFIYHNVSLYVYDNNFNIEFYQQEIVNNYPSYIDINLQLNNYYFEKYGKIKADGHCAFNCMNKISYNKHNGYIEVRQTLINFYKNLLNDSNFRQMNIWMFEICNVELLLNHITRVSCFDKIVNIENWGEEIDFCVYGYIHKIRFLILIDTVELQSFNMCWRHYDSVANNINIWPLVIIHYNGSHYETIKKIYCRNNMDSNEIVSDKNDSHNNTDVSKFDFSAFCEKEEDNIFNKMF
ncbi:Hypothetical protein SRAE_0000046600 [Strongyloides ratti]|uniref:OTU domain-containing protein n=1 Tax=Strongyloides ratti TaxID=34506 RepID=A0A090KUZ8_STRRB|nr:Hypothetical protein SRAE_0000046600 [Strongyloides ratti]CEF61340.1 Hypothetical protein SRAE_0000046600 [Strongyloides ratti]